MFDTAAARVRLAAISILALTPVYYFVPWDKFGSAVPGVLFLVVYTLVLPGIFIGEHLIPRRTDWLDKAANAMLCGLGLVLLTLFIWALTGQSIALFARVLPLALIAAASAAWFRPPPEPLLEFPAKPGERVYTILFTIVLGVTFGPVLTSGVQLDFTKDTIDHIGYINEIRESGHLFPTDAFYIDAGTNGADIRKGLLHAYYGYATHYLGVDGLAFLNAINAFFAVTFLLVIYSASLLLFGDRRIAVLAAIFYFFSQSAGSESIRQSFYPNRFGFLFYLYFVVFTMRFLGRQRRSDVLIAAGAAFAAFATHVFYGVLVAAGGTMILLFKFCFPQIPFREHLKRIVMLGAVVAVALLPYALYRYLTALPQANDLHAAVQGVVFLTDSLYVAEPLKVLSWLGPIGIVTTLAVIPLWPMRRNYFGLGYLMASVLAIPLILFNPFILPVLHRSMTYLVFRLNKLCPYYILTAVFVAVFMDTWQRGKRPQAMSLFLAALLAAGMVFQLRSVTKESMFLQSTIEKERQTSHLKWEDGLNVLQTGIPDGSVVASDPLTSYSIPAFTSNYVMCALDQHAPPNDLLLTDRIRDARDILSPYVSMSRTMELMQKHRVTHVVLNGRLPSGMILDYWTMDPSIYPACRDKFLSIPEAFEMVYDEDDFTVFALNAAPHRQDESTADFLGADTLPEGFAPVGRKAGVVYLDGIAIGADRVHQGSRIPITALWSKRDSLQMANYVVFIRFDHTNPDLAMGGRPFPKIARKIKERTSGKRYRFRADHKISNGFRSPDTWGFGFPVVDESVVTVPNNIAPGEYGVYITMLERTNQPNYRLSDFFYDDDSLQGIRVGTIEIR